MLSVREIQASDIPLIAQYWLEAPQDFLVGMGVDVAKMPGREQWHQMLDAQLHQPYETKPSYCLIWELNGTPVGHSNVNKIQFGKEAFMHLHLWPVSERQKGMGSAFVLLSLPIFFERLQLQKIYCEPYSLNPAPNKTLEKVGFQKVECYVTTPGWLNFEQEVNLWLLSRESFQIEPEIS